MKDTLFNESLNKRFCFDEKVAHVFDDMLERSIPYYHEMLNLGAYFIAQNLKENLYPKPLPKSLPKPLIYDLGCSTGNFFIALNQQIQQDIELVGIDNSMPMLKKAQEKLKDFNNVRFECMDFLEVEFKEASAFSLLFVLQFVRPMQREVLLKKIYNSLALNGVLLVGEKIMSEDRILDKQMIELYYLYKQNQGYSHNEIAFKREALENVLVPYSLKENIALLESVGFKHVEALFKWVNFTLLVARKT
ncbi:carboxy-S-adenosyl-L-methionine synthase CmoA [Helicobacter pylori]|uniref:Carboxy-S-adenosyl-L-methionine synthase n=1 Tax=Helicobacter pylori TaxID=210 RepID=A0A2A6X428_HELPX|nr:carboxy-S-adenosyl-L-methionine synthase CmoA [Helicobacter pylori]MUU76099.1 carboxy-S-adenosyl-L-methionine synthase CmoA [Helicobacter pylori]OOP94707.1 carboxy-S-adenosyl-L-methionine synthase CmoA [Helicobacter pylori]OOQ31615.1 carboxy-S-adenosyl-L-methionine synthase CmoA [Helicobacter pylori]PDW83928.1 tRNA (uridine-5-oxyacetic acid methyl ester)(34) synthase TrmP [Helicobacter pylori]PDX12483.1 tRNA (uridine-5-oxyacetic acid methyl ester)(34) synthase TrmP [Helicobacter pylori]